MGADTSVLSFCNWSFNLAIRSLVFDVWVSGAIEISGAGGGIDKLSVEFCIELSCEDVEAALGAVCAAFGAPVITDC